VSRQVALGQRNRAVPRPPVNVFSDPAIFSCKFYSCTTSTTTPYVRSTMPREAEISVNERAFIQDALKEQIRLDGRAFDAFRPIELTFGDEYGVADVQLGKTRCAREDLFELHVTDSPQSHCSTFRRCDHPTTRAQVRWHLPDRHRILSNGVACIRSWTVCMKHILCQRLLTDSPDLQMPKSFFREFSRKPFAARMPLTRNHCA
jgi:hypothetical protein